MRSINFGSVVLAVVIAVPIALAGYWMKEKKDRKENITTCIVMIDHLNHHDEQAPRVLSEVSALLPKGNQQLREAFESLRESTSLAADESKRRSKRFDETLGQPGGPEYIALPEWNKFKAYKAEVMERLSELEKE